MGNMNLPRIYVPKNNKTPSWGIVEDVLMCTLVHDVRTFYEEKLKASEGKETDAVHLMKAA